MLKKIFIIIIVIIVMSQLIPFLYKTLYGEETTYYNAMPGENVIGKDQNGGFISKPTDSTAISDMVTMEKMHRFVIITLIVAVILSAVFTAFYKFRLFNSGLDILLVLGIVIVSVIMIIMTINEGIKIAW